MKKTKVLSWVSVVIWLAVIFLFSAQPAEESNGVSTGIVQILASVVNMVYPLDMESGASLIFMEQLNGALRTCAHGTVYLILAMLVLNALRLSSLKGATGATGSRGSKYSIGFREFLLTMAFCVLYAVTDEIHQLFVPGRACELFDILVDSSGALLGNLLFFLFKKKF